MLAIVEAVQYSETAACRKDAQPPKACNATIRMRTTWPPNPEPLSVVGTQTSTESPTAD